MAKARFSLESVLKLREAEQEKLEKELARIGQERAREREIGLLIRREREERIASFQLTEIDHGAGNRIAFYAWMEFVGVQIEVQEQRSSSLDAEYEKVHSAWCRAKTEKEKIQILRDRFHGEIRNREIKMEERSLEAWILFRGGRSQEGQPE
jgi:flagellar biosynthesis chaperone FliJ